MRACAVAVAVMALLGATSAVSARQETSLPRSGIAVETSRGVTLVGLDGRVRRTLSGFRFRVLGVERLGQIELRDRSGRGYELRAGLLARTAADQVTLGYGYRLRFRGRWALLRAGRVVERFAPRTHLELDDSGMVLTSFRVAKDGAVLTVPVARHLGTGSRRMLPRGCRVGAERADVRFELCGYPYAKRRVSTIVRVDARGRRILAGSARRGPLGPAGWWRSVTLSPDRDRVLAQWSGECEIPEAHLFDARTGVTRTSVLAANNDGAAVEAVTLGWAGGAPIVQLRRAACGTSADRPGVYSYDWHGKARLIYSLSGFPATTAVAFWR